LGYTGQTAVYLVISDLQREAQWPQRDYKTSIQMTRPPLN